MTTVAKKDTPKPKVASSDEYTEAQFLTVATAYAENSALINAVAKYNNVDEAIRAINDTVALLQHLAEHGAGYTPPTALGFGSDNGSQIAAAVLGTRSSVSTVRQNLRKIGKRQNATTSK